MASMFSFANPKRFMDMSERLLPWLGGGTAIALLAGLILGFLAPPDYQQGTTVKIMFLHVPAAWTAMMAYGLIAAVFTALGLVTGSLWGRPMWGTYWVWDARLTSFLLLLFLYLGYIALRGAIEDETRAARAAAILALVGAVNLPIIEFSVNWHTLHQGESILRADGPQIATVFLWPLGISAFGYTLLFLTLWVVRIRTEILERRARALILSGHP